MKKILLIFITFILSETLPAQTALYFDGVDDHIVVPGTSKLNGFNKITLETWLYSGNFSTSPCADCAPIIWNQGKAYRFGTGNGRAVYFSLQNGSATVTLASTQTLSLNIWHHIAGTYDGSKMRIYIDGIATDSLTSAITITYGSTTADVWIADPVTGWGGILEETRIWDYALSRKEILESMIRKFKNGATGLVLQYGYEDGTAYASNTSVTSIKDNTSNKNHGTPTNFKLKDTVSNFVPGRTYCDTTIYAKFSINQCVKYTLPSKKRTVTVSGTYNDTLVSKYGCDSVMTISLTILNPSSSLINVAACDSFRNPFTGTVYKKTGKHTATTKNYVGCDSVITFNLTIYRRDSSVFHYDNCNSVTLKNGKKVVNSGRYIDTLKSARGCDSFVVHIAKVRKASYAKQTLKVCVFILCPSNISKVFYKPGIYYDTLPNMVGCDSVIEYTVLTANSYDTISLRTCTPLKSPSKKYTYTQTGTYQDTLASGNKLGCDSVITIHLTMDVPLQQSLQVTECRVYKVPSGTRFINQTQTVTDVLKSKNGCDSVVFTIEVTINNPNTGVTRSGNKLIAATANGSALFQWLDCDASYATISGATSKQYSPAKNGNYAVEVKENNCVDTSGCIAFVMAGLSELLTSSIQVSPNPSTGTFAIRSVVALHQVKISLFDVRGMLIHVWEMPGLREQELKGEVTPGLYYLRIESSEGGNLQPLMFR